MGVFPMTMSLVASFMSAITLLGTPAEIYKNGTQYVFLVLAYPLVMFATAYFYMPVFYNLNVSTSYEVSNVYLIFILGNTNVKYVVLTYLQTAYLSIGLINVASNLKLWNRIW